MTNIRLQPNHNDSENGSNTEIYNILNHHAIEYTKVYGSNGTSLRRLCVCKRPCFEGHSSEELHENLEDSGDSEDSEDSINSYNELCIEPNELVAANYLECGELNESFSGDNNKTVTFDSIVNSNDGCITMSHRFVDSVLTHISSYKLYYLIGVSATAMTSVSLFLRYRKSLR